MAGGRVETGSPKIRTIQVIANPASGSVGPNVRAEVEAILAKHDVEAVIHTTEDGKLNLLLTAALAAKPDLLVIIAGDGTARAAAEAAGPDGPLIAPLPGGTMNMLPGAIYGHRDWKTALDDILTEGEVRLVSGGTVEGHSFYVAAILGAPALWARAREAVRMGRLKLAVARAKRAMGAAFTGRLRFTIDGAPRQKSEALTFICPLVSQGVDNDAAGLEAAALDPAGAVDVFRLALAAAAGAWRRDASVQVTLCKQAYVWAGGPIPAILDGETVHLGRTGLVKFKPAAFRALAPIDKAPAAETPAETPVAAIARVARAILPIKAEPVAEAAKPKRVRAKAVTPKAPPAKPKVAKAPAPKPAASKPAKPKAPKPKAAK